MNLFYGNGSNFQLFSGFVFSFWWESKGMDLRFSATFGVYRGLGFIVVGPLFWGFNVGSGRYKELCR